MFLVDVVEFISRVHHTLKSIPNIIFFQFHNKSHFNFYPEVKTPPSIFFTLMNFSLISSCMTYNGLCCDSGFSNELCASIFSSLRLFLS